MGNVGKKKPLVVVAVVVLVVAVVGLGVVIGRALGPSGGAAPSGGAVAPSAAPTAGVNTNLDNVVAGTGATGTASTPGFEGVGTRYPATCVGAVQAAAEWTQKVFGSTDLVGPMVLDSQDEAKRKVDSFLDEITVSPGLIRIGSDNETLGESDFRMMLGMFIEHTKPSERDSVTFHAEVQNGVVQVVKCAPEPEGVAVVRIAAPKGEPIGSFRTYAWYERNYQLQAVNGSWRLVHMLNERDSGPYQSALNPPDYKPSESENAETLRRPVTDEARDIIARSLGGQGTHVFANKNGEWGKR